MILAIDTATRWTGIALHDGSHIVAEMGWHAVNTTTVELAPTVADMLRKTDVAAADLDAIAVAIGPGSYTGLRVGLGFAKGMALAYKLPLIGISTIDILVSSFGQAEGHLVVVTEAGRKRVAAATYRWYSRKGWQPKKPVDIYEWSVLLAETRAEASFAGEISAEARKLIRAAGKQFRIVPPAAGTRRAGYLAELGHIRFRRDQLDDAATLAPIYLREPGGGKPAESVADAEDS
jgi:tRNA threonylcarbamoyladenosine biosynthesis protein TsaB